MQFFKAVFLGVAAMSTVVAAQSKGLYFTAMPSDLTVGRAVQINYMAPSSKEPVTIKLRRGPSNNLHTIATLTGDATGGSYSWTPSTELPSAQDYALEISQGSEINYTHEFKVTNPKAATNSAYSASPLPTLWKAGGTAVSSGGSIPMTRNTTFSSATLTPTATTTTSIPTAVVTTAPAATTTHKGSGSVLNSNLALALGAVAAVACLA